MTCETCGLPAELCVCDDISKTDEVSVSTEERKYNDVTVVSGLEHYNDVDNLETELKKKMACGGTATDTSIELQGDHKERVEEVLREKGFDLE